MDARIVVREHEPQTFDRACTQDIVETVENLSATLRPRRKQVATAGGQVEVRNLVGSVRLASGSILEVEPKVPVQSNWTKAVVQLLEESSRISVTGSQGSRPRCRRADLTTAIAFEFARRLDRALVTEGPIEVFERQSITGGKLNGRLQVGKWLRNAPLNPAQFPVERDEITVANGFTRGLSLVCGVFRRSVQDVSLRSKLRRLESDVLPGQPVPSYVDPSIATKSLPAQWRKYRPAWDIASAVLKNHSVVGDPGHSIGLEVAVEPWPLLETLLTRSLEAVTRDTGLGLHSPAKRRYTLLTDCGMVEGEVEPDGVLMRGHDAVATFEAKYTNYDLVPAEAHRYQALAAAAVLGAPLAVLVYPQAMPARFFDVSGFNNHPAQLVTYGLDLYSYSRVGGAESRASEISQILTTAGP
ncbi:McrBC 5-methylcytosine restriction system component [Mycobacteroides abscessus subsp. massiliense]|nr:hypothetical protein [Mycobacteroides abscessus]SKD83946.1 McrBC 5-methylcytosine restriction system component [Mycobacteroides abscessus subsp. massiliense]SKD87544.1 McrBC 5-methylcytosine restriction system component [Mycobacteroides abscessus subsp. massiliense]SKE39648.1 McrBC 5-methylcytosine restriction system component [Mycobacteroides abscessus subsp. massiliense]SKE40686.1 McrBC 5-methylcytosine restriction system component [Mycobacteroides abscessus subsp. massiliense]SKE44206.1 